MTTAHRYVGVVGPGEGATEVQLAAAAEVGAALGRAGVVLVSGGLGGVMAASCRAARAAGGTTVGLLPGRDRRDGNPHLSVAVPTGLGELRNGLVVRSSEVLVAIGCSWGTLSEIALALRTGVPVVGLDVWELPDGVERATDPADAVRRALGLLAT